MRYELKCDACGHDASEHRSDCDDGAAYVYEGCDRTAASLYAAECARLANKRDTDAAFIDAQTQDVIRYRAERDAARAECRRYKAALEEIANWDEGDPLGPQFDEPWSAMIARTALDGQEKDNAK